MNIITKVEPFLSSFLLLFMLYTFCTCYFLKKLYFTVQSSQCSTILNNPTASHTQARKKHRKKFITKWWLVNKLSVPPCCDWMVTHSSPPHSALPPPSSHFGGWIQTKHSPLDKVENNIFKINIYTIFTLL